MLHHRFVMALIVSSLLPMASPRAQTESPPAAPPLVQPRKMTGDRNDRRLLVRFVEDAAISTGGGVELQYRYDNLSDGNRHFLGPNVAFKIVNDVEAGLRFGWEDVNPDSGSNGSGLSDVDLYAKYRFPGGRPRTAGGALRTLGFQWRTRKGRGGLRGGVSFPLSDGAPDYQLLGGAFLTY